jgi:OFA family oxalate/formate antiporter-like MFS transporter
LHRSAFDIYSLFPSITGDLYGNKWVTTNYGIVYTAKGVATAFAGPGAAWLFAKTGSWTKVFWVMIICDLIAAFMALLWLKPRAARMIAKSEGGLHTINVSAPPAIMATRPQVVR